MYDKLDLYWSDQGDLMLDDDGDLRDTGTDRYRSLYQEIVTIACAQPQDFALWPELGANLQAFIGSVNNAKTAALIGEQLLAALTERLLVPGTCQVEVVPVGHQLLSVILQVNVGSPLEPFTLTFLTHLTASLPRLLQPYV